MAVTPEELQEIIAAKDKADAAKEASDAAQAALQAKLDAIAHKLEEGDVCTLASPVPGVRKKDGKIQIGDIPSLVEG